MRDLKGVDGLKYSVRRLTARFLFVSGATGAWRRLALRKRIVVLMYHRVIPRDEEKTAAYEGMQVAPETFDRQMAYLRKHFRLLSVDDLRRHVQDRSPFPANSCLVTFDDGWKDNYAYAYPVMKRYGIPAVIFLSVGHIGNRKRFWQERAFAVLHGIREAARRDPGIPARFGNLPGGIGIEGMMALPEEKFRAEVRGWIRTLKKLPLDRIDPMLDAIGSCAGLTRDQDGEGSPFLSWTEVEEMSRGGIDFGSHGMSHEILTNVDPGEVRREVRMSKDILEGRIQKSVWAFSYPNGDHNAVVRKCVEACGYDVAFGTEKGFVDRGDEPYALKRVNVHDDATREVPMFLSSILGLM